MDDSDYVTSSGPSEDGDDSDFSGGGGDSGSDDSDFTGKKKPKAAARGGRGGGRKTPVKPAVKRAAPARKRRRASSSEEEEEEEESESEAESTSSGGSDDYSDSDAAPPYGRSAAAAAAAAARRPRRQAAAQATQRIQQSARDASDGGWEPEGEWDGEGGGGGGSPAAAAARVRARGVGGGFGGSSRGQWQEEEEEGEDERMARSLQEELNGLRSRRWRVPLPGAAAIAAAHAAPSSRPRSRSASRNASASTRTPAPRRRVGSGRAAARGVTYAESSDEDSEGSGGRGGSGVRQREAIAALDEVEEDAREIERVVTHRDAEAPSTAGTLGLAAGATPPPPGWSGREFFIKWRWRSYIHCTWEPLSALTGLPGAKRVANYMRRADDAAAARRVLSREEVELLDVQRCMEEQLVEQHRQVERVVAERAGHPGDAPGDDAGDVQEYLVKWEGLPYAEATWEAEADLVAAVGGSAARDAFLLRQQRLLEPSKAIEAQRTALRASKQLQSALETQPAFLKGGQLRDYQRVGVSWLAASWLNDRNVILADEMGLGKTVQCVATLGALSELVGHRGPFLVVVPLSVVPNWAREFKKWTPEVNVVVYVGDSRSREVIRAFEFPVDQRGCGVEGVRGTGNGGNRGRRYRFEVLITTYELVLKDAPLLSTLPWSYVVVDEAHRLKNPEAALYQELAGWRFGNKLLVTGTPIQNNLRELWALLHFLDPGAFPDCDAFAEQYGAEDAEKVAQLHAALRPHLLRRTIKAVERSLPPKTERILRVAMSPLQRQYYRWILTRNFKELNKGHARVSLLNVLGELKKCCNHPFLFESAEENYRGDEHDRTAVDRLIVTSGKMVLLDKLVRRLRQTGHRVLIFSQMVRVLDIISDYLRLRGLPHQRLDGSTPAAQRHSAMEHFNAPDSPDFAFLLSTRAGGLGINLATADTVIIFDSDWNPQNDLQAMARAHRIGQTEAVNIYRFVTSGSVEEDILERAKRKRVLDHVVIQRMDASGRMVLDQGGRQGAARQMFGKDELAAILRFGAEDLFSKGDDEAVRRQQAALMEEDIDAILGRAEVVEAREGGEGGAAEDLLEAFNVADFNTSLDDAAFWERLIPAEERATAEKEEEQLLPRSARLKPEQRAALGLAPEEDEGSDDGDTPGVTRGDAWGDARGGGGKKKRRAVRAAAGGNGGGGKKAAGGAEPGPPIEGAAVRVDEWPLDVDEEGRPLQEATPGGSGGSSGAFRTISRRDAGAFVRAVRRWGLPSRLQQIAAEVGPSLQEADPRHHLSLWRALVDGCKAAVEETPEDAKDALLDFFGAPVRPHELLSLVSQMKLLHRRVSALESSGADPSRSFRLAAAATPAAPKWGRAIGWGPRDDTALLLGVYWHGLGHWEALIGDPRLGLAEKLAGALAGGGGAGAAGGGGAGKGAKTPTPPPDGGGDGVAAAAAGGKELVPKASHLETRVLSLLRKMHAAAAANEGRPPKARAPKRRAASHPASGVGSPAPVPATANGGGDSTPATGDGSGKKRPALLNLPQAAPAAAGDTPGRKHAAAAAKTPPEGSQQQHKGGDAAAGGGLSKAQCHELLSPVPELEGLRKLQHQEGLTDKELLARTKQCLAAIGRAIDDAASRRGDAARTALWRFVSRFTHNNMDGPTLQRVYERVRAQQGGSGGGGGQQQQQQQQRAAQQQRRQEPVQEQQRRQEPVQEQQRRRGGNEPPRHGGGDQDGRGRDRSRDRGGGGGGDRRQWDSHSHPRGRSRSRERERDSRDRGRDERRSERRSRSGSRERGRGGDRGYDRDRHDGRDYGSSRDRDYSSRDYDRDRGGGSWERRERGSSGRRYGGGRDDDRR